MNLYTDDNPETTIKGLGFKNKEKALHTVETVEKYFESLKKSQKIPGLTPEKVRPQKLLQSKEDANKYYQTQKWYRIMGMLNRARGMIYRVNNKKDIMEAMIVFEDWIKYNYRV